VREVDYLIVGQGLAGLLLACLIQMGGKSVLVIDNGHRTAASLSFAVRVTGLPRRAKGVLQAPFATTQLIGSLERGEPIHPDFDVCRKSLWR